MKKMLTIDDYIKFTDEMKEAGVLDKDFHIIQYKDGCCLGVNGKSLAFEDGALDARDYLFWNEGGFAHTLIPYRSIGVAPSDNGDFVIQKVPALVPKPSLNHPYSDGVGRGVAEYAIDEIMMLCKSQDRTRFAFVSGKNGEGPLSAWVGGERNCLVSAFASLMKKDADFARLIHDAIRCVVKDDAPTDTTVS